MADRTNWDRERTRDRVRESGRENWGRGRDDWREEDREREFQYAGGEERNRDWDLEADQRRYEGYRGPEGRWQEGPPRGWRETRWQDERGYRGGPENRGYENIRDYDEARRYEGARYAHYGRPGYGDYGPGAFTRQFRSGTELYGAGQRGYGTTWGGYGGAYSGYVGGVSGLSGGIGQYSEPGSHVGRGPKGYQRSDERIREDVCERLTQHPHIDAREIEIQVKSGEVYLTGSVESREEKHIAEDVAESISGVRDVHNQLRATGMLARQSGETSRAEMASATPRMK